MKRQKTETTKKAEMLKHENHFLGGLSVAFLRAAVPRRVLGVCGFFDSSSNLVAKSGYTSSRLLSSDLYLQYVPPSAIRST